MFRQKGLRVCTVGSAQSSRRHWPDELVKAEGSTRCKGGALHSRTTGHAAAAGMV
ncbi:MAG: hypothetical protein CM15mP74_32460 [Halieaceae bacterium]|nr:MAG: hypothetical protein CM15mP74_32460 [Halieaceae bacterium]